MSFAVLHRHRHLISLLIVALWLGWTGMGLAKLGKRPAADPAVLVTTLERIPASVRAQKTPAAVLLPSPCSCAQDATTWAAIGQVLEAQGGVSLDVTHLAGQPDGIELLVFDAAGQPVYSGPLSPPPGACGRGSTTDPGTWLPALIDGRQPPLHLGPSPCHC